MNITENALVMIWIIAGGTSKGCVAIMQILNDMMKEEIYDREMIINAKELAFARCQQMQIEENSKVWAGDLDVKA